jgi:pimeloyl-ACP methyl ester carboxylesterase
MASDKPPLVLLHGITMSGNAWQDVVPLLSDHHEVFTLWCADAFEVDDAYKRSFS